MSAYTVIYKLVTIERQAGGRKVGGAVDFDALCFPSIAEELQPPPPAGYPRQSSRQSRTSRREVVVKKTGWREGAVRTTYA